MHLRLLLHALLDSIRAGKRIPMTRMTTIYSSRGRFTAEVYITLEERRRNANTAPMWVSFRRKASWNVMVVKTSFDVPQFAMDLYVEGQSFCNPGTIRGGHPIEMSCAAFEGNPASVTSIYAEVDGRGIYECYKQDNRASWACFKD